MRRLSLLLSLIGLLLLGISGCNGAVGSGTGTGTQTISITLSPSSTSMDAGTSQNFNATLSNDLTGVGVTWTATGGATLTNVTNSTVTVTAPATSGSFTLTAKSVAQPSRTQSAMVVVDAMPAVSGGVLADGVIGKSYSASLAATGGVAPLTWSVTSGSLPGGLTLNGSTGVISGTPSATGQFSFTVQLVDSSVSPQSSSQAKSITVRTALAINQVTPASGIEGTAYNQAMSATGGASPYAWSVIAGSLPAGLTINPSTGAINGIPTSGGSFSATIQTSDSSAPPQTATFAFSMTSSSALTIGASTLPDATTGSPYPGSLNITGGITPLTFSVTQGALPAGLALDSATGTISGTATAAGTTSFTVHGTDSSVPPQTVNKSFTLRANAPIVFTSSGMPSAAVSVPYSAGIPVTGPVSPLTFSITVGTLPPGLTLNTGTGVISGTPTTVGTSTFTVQVTDTANPPRTSSQQLTIVVNSQFSITSSAPPNGTRGILYGYIPTVSGGTAPLTWTISAGTLPSGLIVSSTTGAITGIPLATGSSSFTLKVTDSSSPALSATFPTSITINGVLSILTSTLPNAVAGLPFSTTVSAGGAVAPLSWSISSGALPNGMSINGTTGVISGTTAAIGPNNFTLQVTDSAVPPRTATQPVGLSVNAALVITPVTLPDAVLGVSFNASLAVTGGVAPFTWSVSNGSLAAGLSLSSTTGVISGTPGLAGMDSFTVQVTDHSSPPQMATLAVSLKINSALSITTAVLPDAIAGVTYVGTLVAIGGTGPFTWSVSAGALPNGLILNGATGLITGTVGSAGTTSFTVQAADSSHPQQTKTLSTSIRTNTPLSILPMTLPDAIVGLLYDTTVTSSGGVGPVTWSISAGSLPTGVSINASAGVISGTPAGAAGSSSITVQATDSSSPPQVQTLPLDLNLRLQLAILPVTLPPALLGTPFSSTLTTTGGVGPFTWSVSAGALPGGIALDPETGILSGSPLLASVANFTVKVTDSGNPTQTASLALSLNITAPGVNNNILSGDYAFLFNGFDSDGPVGIAGSFTSNAAGSITSGTLDINRSSGVQTNLAISSGIFAINVDNRGTLSLTTSVGTQNFRIALDTLGSLGHLIEFDTSGTGVIRGNGLIKHQDSGAFSNAAITGSYAFGFSGSTSAGGRSAIVGSFKTNGAGGISSGLANINSSGTVSASKSITNTSTYSISASGRGTLALNVTGQSAMAGTVYVVSANELIFLRTDALSVGHDLLSGEIMLQTGAPFASLPLVGTSVLHVNGNASATTSSVGAGLVVSTGLGVLAGAYDANDGGTISSTLLAAGSYSISSAATGQGSMTFAGNHFTFYLVNTGTAFVMDSSGTEVKTGMFEGQSVLPLSLSSVAGNYVVGTDTNTNANVTFESGVLSLSALGSLTGTLDANATGDVLSPGNLLSGVISLSANGRITLGTKVSYAISPTRFVQVDVTSGQTNATVLVADE